MVIDPLRNNYGPCIIPQKCTARRIHFCRKNKESNVRPDLVCLVSSRTITKLHFCQPHSGVSAQSFALSNSFYTIISIPRRSFVADCWALSQSQF
jgi:hypothetical protein